MTGARRLLEADEAELAHPVAEAEGLEDAEGAVLHHVGDGALAVEQAQHGVDRVWHRAGHPRNLLLVALVDRGGRELAADRDHLGEEALGVGEQLGGLERDLAAADHVLGTQLEAPLCPEQQLVERGEPVEEAGLRRGDLPLEEAELAAPQAAHHREDTGPLHRAERADEVVEAEVLGEIACQDFRVLALGTGEEARHRHRVAHVCRLAEELGRALVDRLRPRDTVADVEDRDLATAPDERAAHLGEDSAGLLRAAAAGDDHLGRLGEGRRVELVGGGHAGHRHSLSLEPETQRLADPRVGLDENQSRNH